MVPCNRRDRIDPRPAATVTMMWKSSCHQGLAASRIIKGQARGRKAGGSAGSPARELAHEFIYQELRCGRCNFCAGYRTGQLDEGPGKVGEADGIARSSPLTRALSLCQQPGKEQRVI